MLAKLILEYLKRRVNKADMPINFIIEEAHRLVKNETNYGVVGLQTGHALVFGSAIILPTLTKFEQARPKTDSDNAKISEKWYVN